MKQQILAHKKTLVFQTKWEVDDFSNPNELHAFKYKHDSMMLSLIKEMQSSGTSGFMIGAGGCSLCKPCVMPKGILCKYPESKYSCMSTYCIYVKKLAEECNMDYDIKDNILPLFSMYTFD